MTGEDNASRRTWRLPSVTTAAGRHHWIEIRKLRFSYGCASLLAGTIFPFALFVSIKVGLVPVLLTGLLGLFGTLYFRIKGLLRPLRWMWGLGLAALLSASWRFAGFHARWLSWGISLLLITWGITRLFNPAPGPSLNFHQLATEASHAGCRIAFFRPFNPVFAGQARNLLVPILEGYGWVFFVSNDAFLQKRDEGAWGWEYQTFPGLMRIKGHHFPDEEWRLKVLETLDEIDIAVIDVSVPSPNVVWEVKQCYDRLPPHRVILVASTESLARDSIQERTDQLLESLRILGADPKVESHLRFLVYLGTVDGRMWLEQAIQNLMLDIIAIETTGQSQLTLRPVQ